MYSRDEDMIPYILPQTCGKVLDAFHLLEQSI
jgi:hypothetical protein